MKTPYEKYGVKCFRNIGIPFKGMIKSQPTDFIVKEIGLNGQIAGTDRYVDSLANLNSSNLAPCKKHRSSTGESSSNNHHQPIPAITKQTDAGAAVDWNLIRIGPKKHLGKLIGDAHLNQIEELSLNQFSLDVIELGSFEDKNDRTILHQCIRQCFPNIKSVPVRRESQTVITCCVDPAFKSLVDIGLTPECIKELLVFINCRLLRGTQTSEERPLLIGVAEMDRTTRGQVHHFLQREYGKFLESKTVGDKSDSISVRFKERKENRQNKRKREEKNVFSFVFRKENIELLHALNSLAKVLKVDAGQIKYAGIKDKKAVTYQFLSVSGAKVSDLKSVSTFGSLQWKVVGEPTLVDDELRLGDLSGNHFEIVVKDVQPVEGSENDVKNGISSAIEAIKTNGFLNYFGEQRFGIDLSTALIGKHLFTGEFIKALNFVFAPLMPEESKSETLDVVEKAKQMFHVDKNIDGALKMMPNFKVRECQMLKALKRYSYCENGCVKAFMNIPFAARLFYLHSYCSYVWNRTLSIRVERFGFDVLEGDLVQDGESVRPIMAEEVKKFHFRDVLLPFPGSNIMYPENETRVIMDNLLREDGLQAKQLNVRRLGIAHIPGSYRRVLSFSNELEYKFMEVCEASEDGKTSESNLDLCLEFILPPSTYATILLREILNSSHVL
ncbi:pseudouridylate synthase PUS7L-like [Clytia hemisphaerica]|uniref:TRUD domain-containing protein n=1 Tax=Clytia hemisphaerica TaxID=252671 RepID=A0A7M5XIR0_9CNID|eukprot:TCONS_00008556-protein